MKTRRFLFKRKLSAIDLSAKSPDRGAKDWAGIKGSGNSV